MAGQLTINLLFPQGEPSGICIADIATATVQAVLVPRNKLSEASGRAELRGVGVYFLFGRPKDEGGKPLAYIGEAENCHRRFMQHHANKEFWYMAVAIVSSKTHGFTTTHAQYLEWYCIKKAKEAGQYELDNDNEGGKPHVTEWMQGELDDAFDNLNILLLALRFPLFELRQEPNPNDVFELTGKDCEGRGHFDRDGFTVLSGSKARKEVVASALTLLQPIRQALLASRVLVEVDNDDVHLLFKEDHTFATPSAAADVLLGCRYSGWEKWKDRSGRTLNEIKSQEHTEAADNGLTSEEADENKMHKRE